jgi:hypothetical protein
MKSFLIQSFKGGISDYEDKGITGAFKFASNIDPRKKKDSISSGQALADDLLNGIINDNVVAVITASDTNSYWFLNNGKILKRTSLGVWTLAYTDTDTGIVGAAESYNNVGDTFLSWRCATKLHRKRILGTGYTDSSWADVDATVNSQTYPKTNLTATSSGMVRWVNGNLIICNGNTLALVGYDDSYTNNALALIPGNVARALLESGSDLKLAANRLDSQEKSMIFIWDGVSQNYNDKMQLPFATINSFIETEIGVIQFGTDGGLYFFGDTTKLPVTRFPGGGQTDPEGADSYEGLALFGVYGNGTGKSGIYSYGRKFKNADFVLNLEYAFDCDRISAVRVVGSTILFSYKNGSSYGVKKVDTATKATIAKYYSLDLKAPPEFQRLIEFAPCVITMAPLPTGCSIELWRRIDKVETGGDGEGWFQCNVEGGDLTYDTVGGTEATFLVGDKGKCLELLVVLNCSGNTTPEVYKIQPFFN